MATISLSIISHGPNQPTWLSYYCFLNHGNNIHYHMLGQIKVQITPCIVVTIHTGSFHPVHNFIHSWCHILEAMLQHIPTMTSFLPIMQLVFHIFGNSFNVSLFMPNRHYPLSIFLHVSSLLIIYARDSSIYIWIVPF